MNLEIIVFLKDNFFKILVKKYKCESFILDEYEGFNLMRKLYDFSDLLF